MDNTGEDFTTLAINIGLAVATFLLNSGFDRRAILLGEECSVLLNNGNLSNKSPVSKLLHQSILDLKRKVASKLLLLCQDSANNFHKGYLNLILARILRVQNNLVEAKKFYEEAENIMKASGNAKEEAECYSELGTLFDSLSQYDKAQKYQEKALGINIAIGDQNGEAISYENLGTLSLSLGQYDKAREYLEKALAIKKDAGDRDGEATNYGNLDQWKSSNGCIRVVMSRNGMIIHGTKVMMKKVRFHPIRQVVYLTEIHPYVEVEEKMNPWVSPT
ncbi:Tetratricopeptide repeat protein 28 [Stylophora pistillata]|uniref:Tetratricopeptide repeat protein 28 n=1 Tax=Stylophora pistillata TaxID=50429 RepID=A0A2B4SJT8_STYPI|nr:Tetratricopeptide repeat protein 28 [Stylophora pistillata]